MDEPRPSLSAHAWRALTYGVPLAFVGLFFVYPLVSILERGLGSGGDLSVLGDPLTREVLWFSLWQAVASTALTILVALPASYVLGRYTFPGRGVAFAVVTVPFVLPTVVVALAFLAVLPEGLERGWVAILVAHVFFNVAVVVRIVGTFWAGLDPRVSEAAATLGAGPWRSFREVTLPAARARARRRGVHRLPLLAHVVRRRPHSRRPSVLDSRDRDLQPGRSPVRPESRRRAGTRPARLRRPRRVGCNAARGEARSRRAASPRGRRAAAAPNARREGVRRREPRRRSQSSSAFRSPCSSSARWRSAAGTASRRTARSGARRTRSSRARGRRS